MVPTIEAEKAPATCFVASYCRELHPVVMYLHFPHKPAPEVQPSRPRPINLERGFEMPEINDLSLT
jgi:hypothetical protein